MSETTAEQLYGAEHVRRYRETGGEVGHIWKEGSTVLLLTTTGRKTGNATTTPLIYAQDGDRYVIVASKGGAPEHPGWYRNLERDPNVELAVWESGADMVLAAHGTEVGSRTTTTVETVRFARPGRVDFRVVRGPVPHVSEAFVLVEEEPGTRLRWEGELGTDFWA